ncbi:MAG: HlyC/CorC family transporter [Planctomycetes bacterium]|nr:HlyC/CorC family transporter [Planctomycetota bacterium]
MDLLAEFSWHLAAMVVLLGASAFFSASETALFNLSREQLRRFRASRSPFQRATARLMDDPRRVLVTVLFSNMTVNTAFFVMGVMLIHEVGVRHPEALGRWRFVLGTLVPVLVVVLGEVTPKSVAAAMPQRLAPLAGVPLTVLEYVVLPVRLLLGYTIVLPLTRLIVGGARAERGFVTTDELQAIVEVSAREGVVTPGESGMLTEVLDLGERRVVEAMTPRVEVVGCDLSAPMPEALDRFRQSRLTKLVVYDGQMDNVVGVVYAKMAYLHPEGPLRRLVRPVYFVPESKTVESLLKEFRSRRIQFAVVVDEYGGLAGVVTLEDCLELIVGEIEDETDQPTADPVQKLSESEYLLAGDLSVRSWEDLFGVDLPESTGRYATVAGFVTSLLGHLPAAGETVRWRNLAFTVEEVRRHRIVRVRLRLLEAGEADASASAPPGEGGTP